MPDQPLRYCETCGEPNLVVRDGQHIHARCICDWERGFFERVGRTIHKTYWENGPRNMGHWDPPIFKHPNGGAFQRLITVQKIRVVEGIYNFGYKQLRTNPDGSIVYALDANLDKGNNLFIRGPQGSGRGLLIAAIKQLCAIKGVSSTPLPDDFAIFKSKIIEAEAFGKEGEEARIIVSSVYGGVDLLALENIKGEHRVSFSDKGRIPIKSKAANGIDALLARRIPQRGSIFFTSSEFAGEISDTLGDRMQELLESDRTKILTMFAPSEAELILNTLRSRNKYFEDLFQKAGDSTSKKGKDVGMLEKMTEDQLFETLKEGFYFSEVFPKIPSVSLGGEDAPASKRAMIDIDALGADGPGILRKAYREFKEESDHKDFSYYESVKLTQKNTIRQCRPLSDKMSEKEIIEVGKMVTVAASGKEIIKEMIEGARKMKDLMAGKVDQ